MNQMNKIIPSWKLDALRANLRRPLFYVYLFLPTLLGALGILLVWMTFAEARQGNFTGRAVSIAFAIGFLGATYKILTFRLTKKSWPAIVFGGICCLNVAIGVGMYLSGETLDKDTLQFGAVAAIFGPVLLLGGLFNWRMLGSPASETGGNVG